MPVLKNALILSGRQPQSQIPTASTAIAKAPVEPTPEPDPITEPEHAPRGKRSKAQPTELEAD